jgi:hypothetical protein
MKKSVLSICVLLIAIVSFGQKNSKVFVVDRYEYDFGTVKQADGDIKTAFRMFNKSGNPVVFVDVVPECSCTEPEFPQETIQAGDSAIVYAGYMASSHPGKFEKKITAYTTRDTFELKIKGYVEPKPLSQIEIDFPEAFGGLRLKSTSFNMGTIYTDRVSEKEFVLYNETEEPVVINKAGLELPEFVTFEVPDTIKPKEFVNLKVLYDANKRAEYGYVADYVFIPLSPVDDAFEIALRATIQEYFDPNMDKSQAPKLTFKETVHDFGGIPKDSTVTHVFEFENTGKTDLIIRQVKRTSVKSTSTTLSSSTIKPGKSATLSVSFNAEGRSGTQSKSVVIYCNDPSNPVQSIRVRGKIY